MRRIAAFVRALTFRAPAPADVVVLYAEDFWLRRLVLDGFATTTLPVFPEAVHVTPALVMRFVARLPKVPWGILVTAGVRSLAKHLLAQYLLACIDATGASVVITLIDNSPIFHLMTRLDDRRTYFAVQNGTRTIACLRDSLPPRPRVGSTISMTNLFCFGPRDQAMYAKYGHSVDRCIVAGSLVGGYYGAALSSRQPPRFDLCIVSQWHAHFFPPPAGDRYVAMVSRRNANGIEGMLALLSRLIDEERLLTAVCLRSTDAAEAAFYRRAFGDRVELVQGERGSFSTFRTIDQSRLTVALNSTVLAEAFGLGCKVLWCNTTADPFFEMPEAGICYFAGEHYRDFRDRVLRLLSLSPSEFVTSTMSLAQYINAFDPARPAHLVIRAAVEDALARRARAGAGYVHV